MTTAKITGYEKNIASIFSDDFAFEIPLYQRPYAWTTENAEELLNDVEAYLDDDTDIENIDPYFLGSIVLIKNLTPKAAVVDGQQRLTTLTILLSVLRYYADEADKALLTPFIFEQGNKFKGTSDRPRLMLRERDRVFFQEYIQRAKDHSTDTDPLDALKALDPARLDTDSQRNIRANALHLKNLLQTMPAERRQRLAEFIIKRCYLVVVAAPERDTAYRVFSVLNRRGLDLSPTDILKADIIGEIPKNKQDTYTKKWEDIEQDLGRQAFSELFAHIRMIFRKVKAQGTTLDEIRKHIHPEKKPIHFIENTLIPLSDAYYEIQHEQFESTRRAEEVNFYFRFLNQVDNFDWIPPAILHLAMHKHNPDLLVEFFKKLERLAACMMVMRTKINDRIKRYGALITAIEEGRDIFAEGSPLLLTEDDKQRTLTNLGGDVYTELYTRYILLRLDSCLVTGEAWYNYKTISIEHVLPQNPKPDSQWLALFPDEEQRLIYTHQLGNLILLSRKKNSTAQNYDFAEKKEKYFYAEAAPFALTAEVRNEHKWTPKVIERRQARLLNVLSEAWDLT